MEITQLKRDIFHRYLCKGNIQKYFDDFIM